MNNPWNSIYLSDYENHMSSDTVMQLQVLNDMMKVQLNSYPATSVMVLGVAGGNGLEHIDTDKYSAVYGVDINQEYLQEVEKRYSNLGNILKCLCIDLSAESSALPNADFVVANLLIEYIGYECFQSVIKQVKPKYISCGIQINTGEEFVSESPYLHSFDGLNSIHHQIELTELKNHMDCIGYRYLSADEYPLPNGKKLVKADFESEFTL
ncbi:MAG: class I SAM-dependent methyltransferase [Huintestinicola sp.]|uniref:class I SAM-dependent methyltransferase n=1 Tax=Huintestinicola sp. TaxID=2981661 RepID=UPI003EFDAF16